MTSKTALLVILMVIFCSSAFSKEIPLTILHTNDMHSHYKPSLGGYRLGGVGRLATAIRQEREKAEHSLYLDGGDWSEGSIYYTLGTGRTAIEVMNKLGLDAAVLGNHDWLQGPEKLSQLLKESPQQFKILGMNKTLPENSTFADLNEQIPAYHIITKGSLRIGIIGLLTFEKIYDRFFSPVTVTETLVAPRKLAEKLKKGFTDKKTKEYIPPVHLVVVLSHNNLAVNKLVAGLPNVDVVIHAHDHIKLCHPIEMHVEDKKETSWIVTAEKWGMYLGRLDLVYDDEKKIWKKKDHKLIPIDEMIPEDESFTELVQIYDDQVRKEFGDSFYAYELETKIDLFRDMRESIYGNVLADAYRDAAKTEIAFEQMKFASDEIYAGLLRPLDLFNALSPIYNPSTKKTWTLKTAKIKGETLDYLINFVLTFQGIIPIGLISTSGLSAVYNPISVSTGMPAVPGEERRSLMDLEVNGLPIEKEKLYSLALSHGVLETIDFLRTFFHAAIPLEDLQDTGVELWRVFRDYLKKNNTFDSSKVGPRKRIKTYQADIALYEDEISWKVSDDGSHVDLKIRVNNFGLLYSKAGRKLKVAFDKTPLAPQDDPNIDWKNALVLDLPSIPPNSHRDFEISLRLPELPFRRLPVCIKAEPNGADVDPLQQDRDPTNDSVIVLIQPTPEF